MDSNGSKLVQMDSNGFEWVQREFIGFKWIQMDSTVLHASLMPLFLQTLRED